MIEYIDSFEIFLLILARMFGLFLFAPLFSQNSVPIIFRAGMSLSVAMLITSIYSEATAVPIYNTSVEFILSIGAEFCIGFVIGFVISMFLSVIDVGGGFIDYQLSLAMGKVYDPSSETNLTITGKLVNSLFILTFFLSNAYLTLIKFTIYTFDFVSPGTVNLNFSGGIVIVQMFSTVMTLGLQMTLPIVASQFLTEMGVGLLTRAIPQVNIFAMNIQIKLFVGLIMLFFLLPIFGTFCEKLIEFLFENIERGMIMFAG